MKAPLQHYLLILAIAVVAILARPCLVFASQSLTSPYNRQTSTADLRQVVRKRNEYAYSHEEAIVQEDIRKKIKLPSLNPCRAFLKSFQLKLLSFLSSRCTSLTSLSEGRSTVFQISPHNDRYLSISHFRI
jgi:hypothetical protein